MHPKTRGHVSVILIVIDTAFDKIPGGYCDCGTNSNNIYDGNGVWGAFEV